MKVLHSAILFSIIYSHVIPNQVSEIGELAGGDIDQAIVNTNHIQLENGEVLPIATPIGHAHSEPEPIQGVLVDSIHGLEISVPRGSRMYHFTNDIQDIEDLGLALPRSRAEPHPRLTQAESEDFGLALPRSRAEPHPRISFRGRVPQTPNPQMYPNRVQALGRVHLDGALAEAIPVAQVISGPNVQPHSNVMERGITEGSHAVQQAEGWISRIQRAFRFW